MDADAKAQQEAGIHLKQIWRGIEDSNLAFFICEVVDVERAKAFLDPGEIVEAEKEAGASDFQWFLVEQV